MRGTPWEPTPGVKTDAIPVHIKLPEEEGNPKPEEAGNLGEPPKEIRRRARITREEVTKAGFTVGCPGCRAISRNAPAQNHTETCRKRLEEAITKQGGAGAKRIADGNVRFGNHVNKRRQAEPQEEEESRKQARQTEAQEEEREKRQRE